jgi:uncharacterized membrane protein YedE/YeeE
MIELIKQPWTWYFGGVLIGLTVPLLLIAGNKPFGISSSFRHICAACIPSNINYFKYNWKKEIWNLFFVAGIVFGAIIATLYLKNPNAIVIAENTKNILAKNNVKDFSNLLPTDVFNWEKLLTLRGFILICVGGFLVGFGTRYAGGCTSGHAITGLSNLQVPSLIATISFMIGGIVITWFVLPFILNL